MALFSVTCTTCRAALKVNDRAAIGKILGCPRCQSMVHVAPPAGWVDPEPAAMPAVIPMPTVDPLVSGAPAVPAEADWSTPAASFGHKWGLIVSGTLATVVVAFAVWKSLPSSPAPDAQEAAPIEVAAAPQATPQIPETPAPPAAEPPPASTAKEPEPTTETTAAEPPPTETKSAEIKSTADVAGPLATAAPADDPFAPGAAPPVQEKPAKPAHRVIPTRPARTIDVSARLADRLARVEFRGVKLNDFLDFLSDLSTLPITIDPAALTEVGVAGDAPISVSLTDTTVAKALDAALQPLGLGYGVEGSHVIITTRGGPRDALRKVRYSVSDLTGSDVAALAQFATTIRTLIEPDSWRETGGNGSILPQGDALSIEQTGPIHYQILAFCEKLRVARGRALRSRYDPKRFNLDGNPGNVKAPGAVTATFMAPTALERIGEYLQKSSGGCVLVDWQALDAEGFAPDSDAMLKVQEQSLEAAVAQLVGSLDLVSVKIDDRTWQITTAASADRREVLQFYRVADQGSDPSAVTALVQKMEAAVAPRRWTSAAGNGAAYFDAPSGYLVVSQPQDIQAQVRAWLDQQRSR